jgi:hypothetical protein
MTDESSSPFCQYRTCPARFPRSLPPYSDPNQPGGNWGTATGQGGIGTSPDWAPYTTKGGEQAQPAAGVQLGAFGTNLCWGYKTQPGGPSTTREVVFNDLPTIAGSLAWHENSDPASYVKLESVVSFTIQWPGSPLFQTWQYNFTLQRLPGQAATFTCGELRDMGNVAPPPLPGPAAPPPLPGGG